MTGNAEEGPHFEDDTKLLEWVTGNRAIVKFTNMNDVNSKKERLIEVITKWIEMT